MRPSTGDAEFDGARDAQALRQDGLRLYEDFVRATQARLARHARSRAGTRTLPTAATFDDVVQTAYEKLLPRYDAMENEVCAYAYATRIVNSTIRDALEFGDVRTEAWLARVHAGQRTADAPAEERVLTRMTGALVRSAVDALPPDQREAVRRVDLEDAAHAEAAAAMGMPPSTVKGLLQRGRRQMRDDLRHLIGAGLVPPFVRWLRPSRKAVATACCSPAAVAAAALYLSVWHVTLPPGRAHLGPLGATTTATAARPAPATGPGGPAAPAATPTADPSPTPAAAGSPSPEASPAPSASPTTHGTGGCVGDLCLGEKAGDELCVVREDKRVACANQGWVGMCPVADDLPGTTCERHSDPFVDSGAHPLSASPSP